MDFIKKLCMARSKISGQALGINPAVLIAQAALETSWGAKSN